MAENDGNEPWMSVEDAARHLGVQRDTIYKWIIRRRLPAHKAGRLWKFRRGELDSWVLGNGTSIQEVAESRR
ncbi:MAG: helix-turn-helix domain-containing protein [Deltaproteobacteria bacterium]|nr:helix-turn-helix domain-containing protein [Deltaproteobacteria bacterium]